jgi:DNA transformation protein
MSTQRETVDFMLEKLGGRQSSHDAERFKVRAMFGEYALYADGKVVALVCDDLLHVKIMPESFELEELCEKGEPYKGAKLHYVVSEDQLGEISALPRILFAIAAVIPAKVKAKKSAPRKSPQKAPPPKKKSKKIGKSRGSKTKKP